MSIPAILCLKAVLLGENKLTQELAFEVSQRQVYALTRGNIML
ncbi:MAG TPA: hypothetical protein V6D25_07760 [Leptolyngbyaceae cyanobacterium]